MKNETESITITLPADVLRVLRDAAADDGTTVEAFAAVHTVAGVSEWWDSVAGQADNGGNLRFPTAPKSHRQSWYDRALELNAWPTRRLRPGR